MLLTIQAKVVTDIYAGERLLKTMEAFNKACNHISEFAWNEKIFGKIRLQQNLYYKVREQFNLSAQMTVRAIAKVSESYRIERNHKHTFKEHGAIVYDQRILSFKALDKISILTLDGRSTCPALIGNYRPLEKRYIRGQADLCYETASSTSMSPLMFPKQNSTSPLPASSASTWESSTSPPQAKARSIQATRPSVPERSTQSSKRPFSP